MAGLLKARINEHEISLKTTRLTKYNNSRVKQKGNNNFSIRTLSEEIFFKI